MKFVTVNTVKLITQVSNKTGFTVRKRWCYGNKILGRSGFENCILTILHCWTLYMYFIEKLHIIFLKIYFSSPSSSYSGPHFSILLILLSTIIKQERFFPFLSFEMLFRIQKPRLTPRKPTTVNLGFTSINSGFLGEAI